MKLCSHGYSAGCPHLGCEGLTTAESAMVKSLTEIADEIRMLKNAVRDLKEALVSKAEPLPRCPVCHEQSSHPQDGCLNPDCPSRVRALHAS